MDLFNQCTLEWIDTCYEEEMQWIELPTSGISRGRQGQPAFLRETDGYILRLLPDQHLRILNLVVQGDQVALERDWQGTAAAAIGSLRARDQVHFRVASFFTHLNGLIIEQTYYCIPLPP